MYYSRKRFGRPDLQKSPHSSFEEEVEYLQEMFNGGAAYALGKLNGECWYLYTLNRPVSIIEPDQTLEIIMTKLDPEVMKIFTREVSSSAEEASRLSKIDTIFPNAILDAYLFDPCGYSVNAILPKVFISSILLDWILVEFLISSKIEYFVGTILIYILEPFIFSRQLCKNEL